MKTFLIDDLCTEDDNQEKADFNSGNSTSEPPSINKTEHPNQYFSLSVGNSHNDQFKERSESVLDVLGSSNSQSACLNSLQAYTKQDLEVFDSSLLLLPDCEDSIVYIPLRKSQLKKLGVPLFNLKSNTISHTNNDKTPLVVTKIERNTKKSDSRQARMLPSNATEILNKWYSQNEYKYPTYEQKQELMEATNLSLHQINTWFVNKRCRDKTKNSK
ncbi:homeobox protein knotted-1-like protein [Acrasis kona]|uniref:Homeobox protein knotted-1-like protein n=1 Tax=Acrasis kona TaxID=1008807 RepID=A0AAW2YID0_9EUKA